jgi:hypothetical protein
MGTRTALEIMQDACLKLSIEQPTVLFSSTDRTIIELREALIEAADKVLRAHDWQLLKKIEVHTGDGTETEFAMPSDYLRMPKDARVWSSKWEYPLQRITPEEWLNIDTRQFEIVYGAWTIYGGNFVYKPALDNGETAKFFYVSRNVCADTGGTPKPKFTADDDTFRLDDRVLELVLVWTWRQQKGLDYSEDMATAEIALAREIESDKGARIIVPAARRKLGAETAYPLRIQP